MKQHSHLLATILSCANVREELTFVSVILFFKQWALNDLDFVTVFIHNLLIRKSGLVRILYLCLTGLTACWERLRATDVRQSSRLCFYIVMSSLQSQARVLSMSWHVPLLLFTHPLLIWTKASDPDARAHTQTIKSSFAFFSKFSQCLSAFISLSLSYRHTRNTNPHPSHHKSWRPPVLPPPLLGIWRKQCWHSPHPNCSTCSTWPHMFSFLSLHQASVKKKTSTLLVRTIWSALLTPGWQIVGFKDLCCSTNVRHNKRPSCWIPDNLTHTNFLRCYGYVALLRLCSVTRFLPI